MTVYVDKLKQNGDTQSCHLYSDETDPAHPELHAFAAQLHFTKTWDEQDHYVLSPGRRSMAVSKGAKEHTGEWTPPTPTKRLVISGLAHYKCVRCGYITADKLDKAPPFCPRCGALHQYNPPKRDGAPKT